MIQKSNSITKLVLALILASLLCSLSPSISAKTSKNKILDAIIVTSAKMTPSSKNTKMGYSIVLDRTMLEFELESNDALLKKYSTTVFNSETKFYRGRIVNIPRSWARFTEQNGVITGAFYDGKSLFLLEKLAQFQSLIEKGGLRGKPSEKLDPATTTAVIDIADIEHDGTCALHSTNLSSNLSYDSYVKDLQQLVGLSASKEINITLVADTEYLSASGNATADMINALNIADGIFSEQLGVQLTLSDTIELTNNGTLTSTDPEQLIVDFRDADIPNPGLRHLFTGKDLNGSTVGIAYVGSLCFNSSVGVTQRFGSITPIIFAHELGHNFGAPHDNQNGSACSSTASGFIMNPSVSGGLSQFSSCSIGQITPYIELATNGFNACITEVEGVSPSPAITSTPNLFANVGESYQYDSDNTLDVENSESISYQLDISPLGMTIDSSGLLYWIPTAEQIGINSVQVTVQNQFGQDTQYFEVDVQSDFINFDEVTLSPFARQDKFGATIKDVSPIQLELAGNSWKSIPFNYTVTENTILEFEFQSDSEAEIQGIGFETDNSITRETTFNLYGTQNWGIRDYRYSGSGNFEKFSLPVGVTFEGNFNQLIFVMDNDARISGPNAVFKNVRIYESTPFINDAETLDLNTLTFFTDTPRQDVEGTVALTDDGKGVELVGNRWRKVLLNGLSITPTTVIEFEFKSSQIGEIHGLGFLPGSSVDRTRSFQLFGTQNWGIRDFTYEGSGEYQSFIIPVGQYFTQDQIELVFIMDHDVNNPDANSTFRNIVIRDTAISN